MKRLLLLLAAALMALVAVVWAIGLLLPEGHVASRTARVHQSPAALWQAIADEPGSPAWRTDLERVERLPDRDGHPVWREVDKRGEVLTLETVEADPPRRLVKRIADLDLPFGGSWTYEIAATSGGSTVTITERGEVYNPLFRFMSRFIFGHHTTIDAYLKALGRKFGEDVAIR